MNICATNIFKAQNRWPWCCYKLHPLFLPHPISGKVGCQRARKAEAFHFALVDTHCLCLVSPPVWQARHPGLSVAPGSEAWLRVCQQMCVCRFCSVFPGSLLSALQRPNVCAMKIDAGDALFSPAAQAHSLEHGGGSSQLISWSRPEEAEKVLPTPLAWLNNKEHQVHWK